MVCCMLLTPFPSGTQQQAIEAAMEDTEEKTLYKVIPQRETKVGAAMMGSSYVYDMKGAASAQAAAGTAQKGQQDVEIALENPEDLTNLDQQTLQARCASVCVCVYTHTHTPCRYEQAKGGGETEDLSDMVAEHSARSQLKRKKAEEKKDKDKDKDKTKKFKF